MIFIRNDYHWSWDGYTPVSSGYQECEPGHSFGPGIVEVYTIHYVLAGTGVFISKGKEYKIKAGQLFSFAPFEPVHYTADDKDPWTYVWINFIATGNTTYRFASPVVDAPFLRPIFESIRDYPDHATTGRDFITDCLNTIASLLAGKRKNSSILVERTIQYIDRNYRRNDLSIMEIATYLGVSRSTLSAAFTKEKGITFMEYLVRYRLDKACEYMQHHGLSPTGAAYSAGYQNYMHFAKIFRKYHGMSPATYMMQYRNENPDSKDSTVD